MSAPLRLVALLLLAPACADKGGDSGLSSGAARPAFATFPSMEFVGEDGTLDLESVAWPEVVDGSPAAPERFTARRGFSPVQTAVIDLGITLDPASLPTPEETQEAGASVQLWDRTTAERLPAFVELDAWPDNDEPPVMLVRPMVPVADGHEVAVVLTEGLRDSDGVALSPVDWWWDAVSGRPHADLARTASHYEALHTELEGLGVQGAVLAFGYPVANSGDLLTGLIDEVQTPTSWTWTDTQDTDDGDDLPDGIWRALEAELTGPNWLVDDGAFELDSAGLPVRQDDASVNLWVYLPESLREAEAGTAPVWLFGHGIFADPSPYFEVDGDPSGVIDLANRAGAIVVASEWRGLTTRDRLVAVQVGNDFWRFGELADKLAEGVVNNAAIVDLIQQGDLFDDPVFEGLADPSTLRYHGISLGGIEGATLVANTPELEAAVFHVGGSSWSTMLERSSHWSIFEVLMRDSIPSPADRQRLYSLSQLFWDPADPANHADALSDRDVLWQESIYDEQVANLTTEILARGAGATLLEPTDAVPLGLSSTEGPLEGPALARFDPETEVVHETNRPADTTGAHEAPRLWEGSKLQSLRFLDPDDPGVVEHFCGTEICSASNTGEAK